MSEIKLSKRLSTVATYVRDGAFVADIGTDHAYLPIYLVMSGRAIKVLASDINEGPILRAKENIHKFGFDDKIEARIADGLDAIEDFAPTDILICGMGGELIAKIIDSSDYVKRQGVRLILQPMTSIKELRTYLQNGYSTIAENVVCEDNKIYQVICVEYDGRFHPLNEIELEIGRLNIQNRTEEFIKLLFSTIAKKQKMLTGLKIGGCDTDKLEKEIKELEMLK